MSRLKKVQKKCSTCHGSGKSNGARCWRCNGHGTITTWEQVSHAKAKKVS